MTQSEKKLVQITAIGLSLYLVFFFGAGSLKKYENQLAEFHKKRKTIRELNVKLQPYGNRVMLLEKLRKEMNLEVRFLDIPDLGALSSEAIQRCARSHSVNIGSFRESAATTGTSIRFEASGQGASIQKFLKGVTTSGYPIYIESLQVQTMDGKPGQLKMSINLLVLNFKSWKSGVKNA
ncbi:MAG: hypothetical protein LR011_02605 [Verrucomicrobia bacterium]|nr:hypothetical protein [Verrucomicrobiota bacterium]